MWHSAVDIRCIDFVAITAAYNWEPYLALMLGTAMAIQFAAGDTSVGFGPNGCAPTGPTHSSAPMSPPTTILHNAALMRMLLSYVFLL